MQIRNLLPVGEQDIKPPKIENSEPNNYSINTNPKSIVLYFNEAINENDIKNNLLITPYIDNEFEAKVKGKRLEIEFKKPFNDSTTYTIHLNGCVKDITENNEAKNAKFVFFNW